MEHLIDIPYVWGGRDPAVGLDCYGLHLAARRAMGFDEDLPCYLEFYREYPTPESAPPAFLLQILYNERRARRLKSIEALTEGDVVLILGFSSLALATVLSEWRASLFIQEKSTILPLCSLEIKSCWSWGHAPN